MPLPADAPLRREWTLICQARDYPACVSGWEFPGQHPAADASRRFEVIWSADPQVVRTAASTCTQLAEFLSPALTCPLTCRPSRRRPLQATSTGPSACSTG